MMKHLSIKRLLCLVLAFVLVAAVFAGCGGKDEGGAAEPATPAAEPAAPAEGETPAEGATTRTIAGSVLNVRQNTEIALLKVQNCSQSGCGIVQNVYEGLTKQTNGDFSQIRPGLAESWDISDDGLTYVFHIREAKWHDGNPVTADDIIYSLDLLKEYQPSRFDNWASYTATDEHTVTIVLNSPAPALLGELAGQFWYCYSKVACETYGFDTNESNIGTGPYYLEYMGSDKLVIKAFQDYWDPDHTAIIETINFNIITDDNTAFLALQTGELDLLVGATVTQVEQAEALDTLTVASFLSPDPWLFAMNSKVECFKEHNAREAFSYLIDREAVNQAAYNGRGKVALSTYAEGVPVYAPMEYEYNVEKGLALLDEIGMKPEDFTFTLKAASTTATKAIAENVQAQLLTLGMNVTVELGEEGPINECRVTKDFEAEIYDPGTTFVNPLSSMQIMIDSQGIVYTPGFEETMPEFAAQVDELVEAASLAPTWEESVTKGNEAMALIQSEYPWVPLVERYAYDIYPVNLKNVWLEPSLGWPYLEDAYFE